jgi:hypothetical protein
MNGTRILFLSLCCLCLSLTARAELVWEKTELDLHPETGAATAVGVFKYQNKGDKPIHFTAVRPSCGCTTAAMKRNDVPPGEKGEITATFTIGDRIGVQEKSITVETDDPDKPSTVLHLKATIAQFLELQPVFVSWQTGEAPKPKIILARAGKGVTIKNIEVTSSNADFTTKVEPGSGAGEFKINVQPRETAKPLNATLTVKPDGAAGPAKPYFVTARVVPATTAAP